MNDILLETTKLMTASRPLLDPPLRETKRMRMPTPAEIVDQMLATTFSSSIITDALCRAGVLSARSTSPQSEKTTSEEPMRRSDQ